MHSQQLAGLVLLHLVQDDLVALSESLARMVTAVMRLNLDYLLLITASVGEQNVIFVTLTMTAKVGRALALAIDRLVDGASLSRCIVRRQLRVRCLPSFGAEAATSVTHDIVS